MAQKAKTAGGAEMSPGKNIIENAVNSKDHTILVKAVKAAGLAETLQEKGPFTVFAPTNEAFEKLPKGTLEKLMKPENKDMLRNVLLYHVVKGKMTVKDLTKILKDKGGKMTLKMMNGQPLEVHSDNGKIIMVDLHGDKAMVTIPDVMQSNGAIEVINTVMIPKM